MSRPLREGLDFWPIDVDFESDERIAILLAEHGERGLALWIRLLSRLYRVGLCFRWDQVAKRAFAGQVGRTVTEVEAVVETMLDVGLFNREVLDRTGFLTSKGVQRRYLRVCEVCNRRGVRVPSGVVLVEKAELPAGVRLEEKERSKERESRREESRVEETPKKYPRNGEEIPNKYPNNTHLMGNIYPNNTQGTPSDHETPAANDSGTAQIQTGLAAVNTSEVGEGQGSHTEGEATPRGFKGLKPRTDDRGWRKVGRHTALDPIAYEQLAATEGVEIVDRAMQLVEGWVESGIRTPKISGTEIERRMSIAENCTGPLASWALSKAREQLSAERKGRGKKTIEEKLLEVAAL